MTKENLVTTPVGTSLVQAKELLHRHRQAMDGAATPALAELATCTPFTYKSRSWEPVELATAAICVQAPSVMAGPVTVTPPMVNATPLPERRKYQPLAPALHLFMIIAVDPLPDQSGLTQNM